MKFTLFFAFLVFWAILLKPQCSKKQAEIDCRPVCNDVGYDFKGVKELGLFSYQCMCKDWPREPNRIYPQR